MIVNNIMNNIVRRNSRLYNIISCNVINNRYYHVYKNITNNNNMMMNNNNNNNNIYGVRYLSSSFQKENDDALALIERMAKNDESKVIGNTANVKRICNDILSLNFIEVNQLLNRLQVILLYY